MAVWGIVLLGGMVAWYAYDLPDVDRALAATRRPTVTVVAADGSVLARLGDLYGPLFGRAMKELTQAALDPRSRQRLIRTTKGTRRPLTQF